MAASTPGGVRGCPARTGRRTRPLPGSASDSWSGSMLPLASARSVQRSPGDSSAASASSRPPPQGSPSISRTLAPHSAAAWAIQMAAVVAPAPAASAGHTQNKSAGFRRPGPAQVFGQPGGGIGQHCHPFGSHGRGKVPETVALAAQAHENGRCPAPGRQFADIAAHQNDGCGVPEGSGFHGIGHHSKLAAGCGDDPLNLAAQEVEARHQERFRGLGRKPCARSPWPQRGIPGRRNGAHGQARWPLAGRCARPPIARCAALCRARCLSPSDAASGPAPRAPGVVSPGQQDLHSRAAGGARAQHGAPRWPIPEALRLPRKPRPSGREAAPNSVTRPGPVTSGAGLLEMCLLILTLCPVPGHGDRDRRHAMWTTPPPGACGGTVACGRAGASSNPMRTLAVRNCPATAQPGARTRQN